MRLENRIALVTGAASGFGAGIARRFRQEGAGLLLIDIDGPAAKDLADELGEPAKAFTADVSDGRQIAAAVEQALAVFGRIDIVINNAGISHRNRPMLEIYEEEFDRIFAVNVKSIFHMAHAVIPVMRRQGGGVIINIGSTAGIRPRPGLTWYNASKAAVNLLSKSMAIELAPDRIRVCAIAPVMGETRLLETFMGVPDTVENRARFTQTIPLGRMSRPEDIAAAAVYLASDEAALVTGSVLEVDGGRCI